MSQIEISEAAADLQGLIARARSGEEVTLADQGRVLARLLPVDDTPTTTKPPRRLGVAEGKFRVSDDFDAPLPDDLLELFYGGPLPPDEPASSGEKRTRKTQDDP